MCESTKKYHMLSTYNSEANNTNLLRLVIAIFAVVFIVTLIVNTSNILNFSFFHEEHRNLYHFDTTWTNDNDYIAEFLSSASHPVLYDVITHAAIRLGIDLVVFHKIMMLFCAALLILGAAMLGYRVGGSSTAWLTAFLVTAQPVYFYQTNSATPHAFAFPLLMWGLVCLSYGRQYSLALLTVLASLLYAPVSIMLGLSLAWMVLASAIRSKLEKRTLLRVALLVGLPGAIAFIALLAQLAPLDGYGARLGPNEMTDVYPENGLDGRLHISATSPLTYIFELAHSQFRQSLAVQPVLLLMVIYLSFGLYGIHFLITKVELKNAVVAFAIPNALFFIFVYIFKPYISYRFLLYPLFTLMPACFVAGVLAFSYSRLKNPLSQTLFIFISIGIFFVAFHSRDAERTGFRLQLSKAGNELMEFVGELPETAVLAVWPYELQTGLIPYVGKRTLFITGKAHTTAYENHILEMRQRTYDLINAYLATDSTALSLLRCRWKVDFLVVDKFHFTSAGSHPEYFAPFSNAITEIFDKTNVQDMYLYNLPDEGVIFESGNFYVIDLLMISHHSECTE